VSGMRGVHFTSNLSHAGPLDVRGLGIASDSSSGCNRTSLALAPGTRLIRRHAFCCARLPLAARPASGYAGDGAKRIPIRP
jgi:hypothetical protein